MGYGSASSPDGAEKLIQEILDAGGGVLFVDEAYQLTAPHSSVGGRQALDVLLTEMENHLDKLVVIFVGYTKELEYFFDHNPGLQSRIIYDLNFEGIGFEALLLRNSTDDARYKRRSEYWVYCRLDIELGKKRILGISQAGYRAWEEANVWVYRRLDIELGKKRILGISHALYQAGEEGNIGYIISGLHRGRESMEITNLLRRRKHGNHQYMEWRKHGNHQRRQKRGNHQYMEAAKAWKSPIYGGSESMEITNI
ncbi:hypothetical protein EV426DRAFT_722049 [Tirmania nivea]|nr:hypothetical protein EV426DRAFT_722049 [Tirmania nivea]